MSASQVIMSHQNQRVRLECPAPVWWVADAGQTLVVNERNGTLFTLRGTEATVWDWLTIGYSCDRLVDLLAALLTVAPDEAERFLANLLSKWQEGDLLEEVGEEKTAPADG